MPIAARGRGDALHRVAHLQPRALERRRSGGQGPRAVRVADQRQARRDQPGREHQPRREPGRQRTRDPRRRSPGASGNVVTDALHFEGSLILYGELQKRGLDVRLVRPRDWRIDLADMEKAVDRKTTAGRRLAGVLVQRLSARFEARVRAGARQRRLRLRRHRAGRRQHADRRAGERRRLLRLLELQVADGRFRPRLPLRARGSARYGDSSHRVRLSAGGHRDALPAVGSAVGRRRSPGRCRRMRARISRSGPMDRAR